MTSDQSNEELITLNPYDEWCEDPEFQDRCLTSTKATTLSKPIRTAKTNKNPKQKSPIKTQYSQRKLLSPAITTTKPKDIFKEKPDSSITIDEGQSLLLRCQTYDLYSYTLWEHGENILVEWENQKMSKNFSLDEKRFRFLGDTKVADYKIELLSATSSDSGEYRCQSTSPEIDGADAKYYSVRTNVIVRPVPELTPPQARNLPEQNWKKLTPSSINSVTSETNAYISPSIVSRRSSSSPSAAILPSSMSPTSSNSHTSFGAASKSLIAAYGPAALMGLLVVLFVVNIYLISKLVMTCRRRRRRCESKAESERNIRQDFASSTCTSSKPSSQSSLSC